MVLNYRSYQNYNLLIDVLLQLNSAEEEDSLAGLENSAIHSLVVTYY